LEKTQNVLMSPATSLNNNHLGIRARLSSFAHTRVGSIVCLVLAAGIAWMASERVLITTTPSLSNRVFWRSLDRAKIASVKRGDFIIFDHLLPEPKHEIRSVIKRVGCGPGDNLAVKDDYYFCNDQYIGLAKHKTILGNPLTPFVYNGVIPQGVVFAVGDHRDSYDSRYWGFQEIKGIQARAWAIY